MSFLIALAFGAGVAAFVYQRFAPRLGYGNTKNVWTVVGICFVIATIIFYTIFSQLQSK